MYTISSSADPPRRRHGDADVRSLEPRLIPNNSPAQRCIVGPTQDGCALAELLNEYLSESNLRANFTNYCRARHVGRWEFRRGSSTGHRRPPPSRPVAFALRGCGKLCL